MLSPASQHLRLTWETNGKYVTSIENLPVSHLSNKCQGSTCLKKWVPHTTLLESDFKKNCTHIILRQLQLSKSFRVFCYTKSNVHPNSKKKIKKNMGASIKDVTFILRFLTPPSPLSPFLLYRLRR